MFRPLILAFFMEVENFKNIKCPVKKSFKFMLKYKIKLKLFVLNCLYICCIYCDTIQAEVVMLRLLVSLYHFFLNQ